MHETCPKTPMDAHSAARTTAIVLLAALAALPVSAWAEAIPVDCTPGAPRVCLLPDGAETSALVALTVPVGSADEGEAEHGMAHYLEHLTFRGRSVEEGEPTPGTAGIDRWGNAYTTPWATTYHWTVPPERAEEAVARALAVLGPLDASEGAAHQEREIVLREREQHHAGPYARRGEAVDAALYEGTPLARAVIGEPGEIEALDLAGALAFHERHYRARDATLLVAGPVEAEAIREAVRDAADRLGLGTGGAEPDGASAEAAARAPSIEPAPRAPEALRLRDDFGAAERTLDALAPTAADPATLAATDVLDAWLASGLPGAPGPTLVRGRDDLSEAGAAVWEVVPGWTGLGVTLTMRPSLDASGLDAAWSAWEALWSDLGRAGLDEATVARLRDRLVRDVEEVRASGQSAAWNLLAWLESGETVEDWMSYPEAAAAVGAQDVRALLDALADPVRLVTVDAVPGPPPGEDPATQPPASASTD